MMVFYACFLIGMALGMGLIISFARYQHIRSTRRSDLAAIIAALARMTLDDSRKIIPADTYPPWVVFTQRQKLRWFNGLLKQIWPYVNESASKLIRSSVEPVLEQYKSSMLSSLTFSELTFGTVAPQFTGVSIIECDPGAITMELEFQWDGNPTIALDVQTVFGMVLPIQVENIGFTGVFRLIFKPLVNEFPCFGAISYSLTQKKNLTFTLNIAGTEISAIPGISDAIEETIRDAVEDTVTWPVRRIIPILPGDYSDLELKPVGILEVKLIQAKELTNTDFIGKSDPFAEVFVRPLRDRMKTSKTINNELNPIWNEHFEFIVEDASTQHLTVRIFDAEAVEASELIGCAQMALKDLDPGKVKDVWLNLVMDLKFRWDKTYRGQVHLELLYCPYGIESAINNPFDRDFKLTVSERTLKSGSTETEVADLKKSPTQRGRDVLISGVLSVTVISAEDLVAADLTGKSDPYVVLILMKSEQKQMTTVVNQNLDPVWNETFDFVIEDGLHDLLMLEVWDSDMFGQDFLGRCIMTLTKVISEGEVTDTFPLDVAEKGKLNLHLQWL